MNWETHKLSRYGFQLTDCNGQPFFMQQLWVPEAVDGSENWAGIFRGIPPVASGKEYVQVRLTPNDPYSASILISRD